MKLLFGHNSQETAYEVKDYPYGFRLRTSIFYWIETTSKGDRFCSYTINPKNGRANAPKKSTYSTFMYMYLDEANGHVKHKVISAYYVDKFPADLAYIAESLNPSELQQKNLRTDYFGTVRASYPYEAVKYDEQHRPTFKDWYGRMLQYIVKAPFADMCKFRELFAQTDPAPPQDNPEAEVQYTVKTYIPVTA